MGLADAGRGITLVMSGADRWVLLAAGQNVLHPHSHAQHAINVLWWVMFIGSCIGFMLVAFLLLLGWLRRNRPTLPFGIGERGATGLVIGLGIALPIMLLSALFFWSDVFVIRSTAAPSPRSTSLTVHVVGHQWWWEIRYPGTPAVTADELHIPTGTRVDVLGTTADVIHSIWLPELNRKVDVIPGRVNRLLLDTDRPGTYQGECSEYCGLQHAHMLLYAIAQPRARFESWLRHESRPASATGAGSQLFDSAGCGNCHQIRGTDASGQVGPDLTHVASRMTLAAGTIPNDRTHLREWIADPQHVKPGNKMPALHLSRQELTALTNYLESLR
jgi:cytochrome c oxidase subunit II